MATKAPDISVQTKKVVFSVYQNLKDLVKTHPNVTVSELFSNTQQATADACSLSLRSIQRITAEGNKNPIHNNCRNQFLSSTKKKPHKKWITGLDGFDRDVVRRTVLEFYDRGEYVTCDKLKNVLRDKIGFRGGRDSMRKVLKKCGFTFKKCNDGRRFLMERDDIVTARLEFLRKMHDLREDPLQRPIVYLDETWINQNHTKKYIWQHSSNEGGLRVPIGKGSRLIIVHAGSAKHGFIEGAELVFQSKCTGDYHKEMNHEVFTEWFVDMLKLLDEGCIVVMDNASYHSKLKEKIPSSKTKKKDITEWLTSKGIPHNPRHTVRELLNIVRSHRKEYKRFEIDDIALWMGHEVVRLPPYHCQYNPIELIWSQVKGEVAEQNKTFKIKDVRNLLEESIKRVTVEDWKNCVRHSENIQKEDFLKEIGIRDDNFQRIVVDLQNDTTDSDSTDDIDMESTDGIEF